MISRRFRLASRTGLQTQPIDKSVFFVYIPIDGDVYRNWRPMDHLDSILEQISRVGPVLPGSLDRYYNVCGKPGCRCKDQSNPQKHGPYYRLSYSLAGKNSSLFVSDQDAPGVERMVRGYRKLRKLTVQLALATLESVKEHGLSATLEQSSPAPRHQSLKRRLEHKSASLKAAQGKIRDLTFSREKWKQECARLRDENRQLHQQLAATEQSNRKLQQAAEAGEKKAAAADSL